MYIKKYTNGASPGATNVGASPGATNVGASPGATNVGASPGATTNGASPGASYNHFKGSKKAFNCNPYNGINIVSFEFLAMLEGFKSAINKIFILNICKKVLIKIKIIIKIIVLIRNTVNDIKYQKSQH